MRTLKTLLLTIILTLFSLVIYAGTYAGHSASMTTSETDGGNRVYGKSMTVAKGEKNVIVDIYLENQNPISAMQFDIKLPEGIEVETGSRSESLDISLGKERFSGLDHMIASARQDDGTIRVLIMSMSNKTARDTDRDGNDIRKTAPVVQLLLSEGSTQNAGTYIVNITDIVLSGYESGDDKTTRYTPAASAFTLSVTDSTTKINNVIDHSDTCTEIYNLNGVRQTSMTRGINILKMKDGSQKKVIK